MVYDKKSMHYLHTMLRVHNLEVSLKFYCDLLGLVEVTRKENEKGRYTLVFLAAPDDLTSAQSPQKAPMIELTYNWPVDGVSEVYGHGRNFGHLAFRVDDIYKTCELMMKNGVTINRPPRDGHMAFVRSPDLASIELLQKGNPLPPQEPWLSMPNTGEW